MCSQRNFLCDSGTYVAQSATVWDIWLYIISQNFIIEYEIIPPIIKKWYSCISRFMNYVFCYLNFEAFGDLNDYNLLTGSFNIFGKAFQINYFPFIQWVSWTVSESLGCSKYVFCWNFCWHCSTSVQVLLIT